MSVIITDKDKPKAKPDTLLVNNTANVQQAGYVYGFGQTSTNVPQNKKGLFYSVDGAWKNIVDVLVPQVYYSILSSIEQLIVVNRNVEVQSIQYDVVAGTNVVPHNLGLTPSIIQFYQKNILFNAGFFPLTVSNTNITFESDENYSGMKINLLAFK